MIFNLFQMKKKLSIIILVMMVFSSTITSCYKDKGNYDYHALNDVAISGIEDSYLVINAGKLVINPSLSQSQLPKPDSAYTYQWFLYEETSEGYLSGDRIIIGSEMNLEWISSIKAGDYALFLRVTDKETGVFYENRCHLYLKTEFNTGWLVLSEKKDGAPLFSIVGLEKDTPVYFYDALQANGVDYELTGKPLAITRFQYTYYRGPIYGVYISTTTGTNKFDINDSLTWKPTNNIIYEMAGDFDENYAPDFIYPVPGDRVSYMYKDSTMYFRSVFNYINYGIPINLIKGTNTTFKVSPYIAGDGRNPSILYDVENHRFVRHLMAANSSIEMPDSGDDLFPYQDPNYDLVYMKNVTAYNPSEAQAIMKNKTTGKYYCLNIYNYNGSLYESAFREITATDFDKAEDISISRNRGYIFYHVGGKVYEYDPVIQKTYEMMDLGSANITFFGFMKYSVSDSRRNQLLIATYNESNGGGTFKVYDVPTLNGPLELLEEYSGFDKIVDIAF